MHVSDASFINYCRAKKATKKLKIHGEYKVLRIEVKTKLNKLKKYYQYLFEKKYNKKTDLSKTWEAIHSIVKVGGKSKRTPCSLKEQRCLTFQSSKDS